MYEKMTITQLEQAVRKALTAFKGGIVKAAETLQYLQKTRRYKENKRYAKEPFMVYLEDQFGIREGTYKEWVRALPFKKEAKIFGIGLVAKTRRHCGEAGTKRVFKEIMELEEVKKKSIPRDKIETIIVKHQDPKRVAAYEKKHTNWQAMYKEEKAFKEIAKNELKKAHELITELKEQIRKLRITAEMMLAVKRAMNEPVAV